MTARSSPRFHRFHHRARHLRAPAPQAALYDQALRALGEGLPRVAVYKLKTFLQTSPAPAAHRDAVLALARALLAVPDAPAALALLDDEFPPPPGRRTPP